MRHALNFLIIFLVSASSLWAGQVRVASWNLNNYLTFDRLVDGVYREDYPKPEDPHHRDRRRAGYRWPGSRTL